MADPEGRTLGDEEVAALERVIRSGMLNSVWGTEAKALEREMVQLYGSRHAIACSSGTAALHLSVVAAAPDPGDEIITTPITDFGTVAPILAQNAVPVFADVDPSDGNLDPSAVEALIGPRTRAIMAVHLFGAAARIDELRALADRHGLALIEDCAQAWLTELPARGPGLPARGPGLPARGPGLPDQGPRLPAEGPGVPAEGPGVPAQGPGEQLGGGARGVGGGRLAGTVGDVGTFSLQQWKHITCGDGGVVITQDDELARRMRLFSDKGWDRAAGRSHASLGLNYRMTELQAAVARAQLAKLDGVLAARRRTAAHLLKALEGLQGLRLPRPEGHAWWLFPLVLPDGGGRRAGRPPGSRRDSGTGRLPRGAAEQGARVEGARLRRLPLPAGGLHARGPARRRSGWWQRRCWSSTGTSATPTSTSSSSRSESGTGHRGGFSAARPDFVTRTGKRRDAEIDIRSRRHSPAAGAAGR
ncbi:DegT/DnrJ/EryC1/StrS family aminotransferase [Nonomuraea dietziae]|uniref:DegT/DnrJ/EryC1/StrS family aminotransferase n=1 Tax=Nonomuraea dietziae TaxID=65515 RepID=UPI0031DAAD0D